MEYSKQAHRELCTTLYNSQAFVPFAWHFAQTIERMAQARTTTTPDSLFLAAMLVAQNTVAGKHVCLDLNLQLAIKDFLLPDAIELLAPAIREIVLPADLEQQLLTEECSFALSHNNEERWKPLVLDSGRLYMQRFFKYERICAQALSARAHTPPDKEKQPDESQIKALTRLHLDREQIYAVQQAVSRRLCVITGSPGTGKTTIVGAVATLLLQQQPDLKIALCAPTGKAQARLKEALDHEIKSHLILETNDTLRDRLASLPSKTIHRLLKLNPATGRFQHNRDYPLHLDVLIMDEVSMVDLPLLTHLLRALPANSRLILLGDSDQLSAVETGAALAEICDAWQDHGLVTRLVHSHRFDPDKGIGKLKDAIRHSDPESWRLLTSDLSGALSYDLAPECATECEERLQAFLTNHPFTTLAHSGSYQRAFEILDTFRILCATRHGVCGVENINRTMQRLLGIPTYGQGFPLMITVNDYSRHLFNGDIGICWQPDTTEECQAWFPDPKHPGQYRSFHVAELPPHTPVFAMTIHKAQGSGFNEVLLILPPSTSPLLTRELLYTAITRSRKHCAIWSSQESFMECVNSPTRRMSGLKDRLLSTTPL